MFPTRPVPQSRRARAATQRTACTCNPRRQLLNEARVRNALYGRRSGPGSHAGASLPPLPHCTFRDAAASPRPVCDAAHAPRHSNVNLQARSSPALAEAPAQSRQLRAALHPPPALRAPKSTCGARSTARTHRTRTWRSTSAGTWTGSPGWSHRSRQRTCALAAQPP